jgi:hypothetical protein
MFALGLLVERRDEMAPLLDEVLFDDPRQREGYRLLIQFSDARQAIENADDEVADLLQRSILADSGAEPRDVANRLLQEAVGRTLSRMTRDARVADDQEEYNLLVGRQHAWLKVRMMELDDGDRTVESADQLLAWLIDHSGKDDVELEGTR